VLQIPQYVTARQNVLTIMDLSFANVQKVTQGMERTIVQVFQTL
jgi:hypothetical protein